MKESEVNEGNELEVSDNWDNLIDMNNPIDRMLARLPFSFDWVEYKGEIYVAAINYEATVKAHKPMLDMSYCMTKAICGCVLFTCQYDKKKFKLTTRRN